MMRLTFEFEGVREFDRAFISAREPLTDLRPVWPAVERTIQRIEAEHFKSEGAKGRSGKWKPLTRKYADWKEKHYPGKTILRRTDALYNALTGNTGDTISIQEKQEFGFGTSLFYQPFVNEKRPIVDLSADDQNRIMKEMQKEILREMRNRRDITQVLDVEQ